jgi:hypothetical protein
VTTTDPVAGDAVARGGPDLATVLDLQQTGPLVFTASPTDTTPMRMFGGRVAGQAVIAAGRTVAPDRALRSRHAHFLRATSRSAPTTGSTTTSRARGPGTDARCAGVCCSTGRAGRSARSCRRR